MPTNAWKRSAERENAGRAGSKARSIVGHAVGDSVRAFCIFLFTNAILASAQVHFNQTVYQAAPDDIPANAVVAADFNKDGILDLEQNNDGASIFYEGLGGGMFSIVWSDWVPTGLLSGQIVAADFNHDGNPDIAFIPSRGTGGVTILFGNGDGTFNPITQTIDVGGTAESIALADFNGDHLPDIAVSVCQTPSTPPCDTKVLLGHDDGTFTLSATLPDGGGPIVAGDFNGDGHQDLAVVAGNEVALFLGKADGTFDRPVLASLSNVTSLAVGDFFCHHHIQSLVALVVAPAGSNQSSTFIHSLRFAQGNLLVEHERLLQDATLNPYRQIAAGDLNGDFKDDVFLAGGNKSPVAAYLLGNGDGTFQAPVSVATAPVEALGGTLLQSPFIRDLVGDSRHDVGMVWDYGGLNSGTTILLNINATPNCSLPPANALGVHICAPQDGQAVGSKFTFRGSGNALNGIAKRMELWIDGKKVAEKLEDQLKATVHLKRGNHVATFVVVDSFDDRASRSVHFETEF